MSRVTQKDRRLLADLAALTYGNPFSESRIDNERKVLGSKFVADEGIAWSHNRADGSERPNVIRIQQLATALVEKVLEADAKLDFTKEEVQQYWDVVTYVLLYRHIAGKDVDGSSAAETKSMWAAFGRDYKKATALSALDSIEIQSPEHLFACLCQVRRAFTHIFFFILGDSRPVVRLRGQVWESIFTNDLRRYRRTLFNRMGDLPTLVTGPSGTGKELVARAIGMSQYIPFDGQAFAKPKTARFHALNLSALSETLIESELFGHRKGAFTGAVADRIGWFEQCAPHASIFLDEIGELSHALQVKLLRVVQQRTFTRIGDISERRFTGKLIGATNRDLGEEMREGRFREDLYYRLCADQIRTPSLQDQLKDRPEDLETLSMHIAKRLAGDDAEALCDQAVSWIRRNLGSQYPWRGNIRELEQCVSSILIRGEYLPTTMAFGSESPPHAWVNELLAASLTGEQALSRYCTWVYFRTGSYEAAGRQLGLDRRTVKSRVDEDLLYRIRNDVAASVRQADNGPQL